MASSFPSTASLASTAVNSDSSSFLPLSNRHYHSRSMVSCRLSPKPKLWFSMIKGLQPNCSRPFVVRAQHDNDVNFSKWFPLEDMLTDVGSFINKLLEPSVDTVMPSPTKDEVLAETKDVKLSVDTVMHSPTKENVLAETNDVKQSVDPSSHVLAFEEPIADEFIIQVSNLVKLVDSKDIMELHLKQLDFELLIRKKEAITIQASSAPIDIMQPSYQPPPLTAIPTPAPAPPSPTILSFPAAPKPSKSSLPPLKSPMAGTFYRSLAPGEPPFVKVGDKVQKGQVLCIIEAMKLMNEIEADQSGTIVEIVAEDGKPVSFDTPLLVIEP